MVTGLAEIEIDMFFVYKGIEYDHPFVIIPVATETADSAVKGGPVVGSDLAGDEQDGVPLKLRLLVGRYDITDILSCPHRPETARMMCVEEGMPNCPRMDSDRFMVVTPPPASNTGSGR